jgi:hypothetical protein
MTLPATLQELTTSFARVAAFVDKESAGGKPYIKMSQEDGAWLLGMEGAEIAEDQEWAINPFSIQTGYSAFSQTGSRLGQVMSLLNENPPQLNELPDVGAEWGAQISFEVKGVRGEDDGTEAIISQRSKGGMRAAGELIGAIQERIAQGLETAVPVIVLGHSSYLNKKFNRKILTPILQVQHWVAIDGSAGEGEGEDEPKKVKRKPRAKRTS